MKWQPIFDYKNLPSVEESSKYAHKLLCVHFECGTRLCVFQKTRKEFRDFFTREVIPSEPLFYFIVDPIPSY